MTQVYNIIADITAVNSFFLKFLLRQETVPIWFLVYSLIYDVTKILNIFRGYDYTREI